MSEFKCPRRAGFRMAKIDVWWWLSVPYSVIFPLLVLVFRLEEGVGHAAALFVLVSFLTTLSSAIWMFVTIYKKTASRNEGLTWRQKVKLALVLLAALLWVLVMASPL
jgi:hypothetical protein